MTNLNEDLNSYLQLGSEWIVVESERPNVKAGDIIELVHAYVDSDDNYQPTIR